MRLKYEPSLEPLIFFEVFVPKLIPMPQLQIGQTMQRIDIAEPTVPIPRLPTPPSNGLGAEEDSLQNTKMLRPKPVYRDMAKYKKYAGKVRTCIHR